ncbi:PAS domain-containing protein [Azospira restricta]|uniref:histidine kinase n=1 Tax=Azospira restricta TaxID=404405 RepID=A0A974PXA7_9RHOO|nr:PAS domain-containing protein [Azospira restricta]QRJ63147.1 PAS domain-containing protein [Azospira restricta]
MPARHRAVDKTLTRLADAAAEPLALLSRGGEILHANPAFCALHGYRCSELLGRELRFLSDEPRSTTDAFGAGRSQILLRIHRRKGGGLLRLELRLDFPDDESPVFLFAREVDGGGEDGNLRWRNAVEIGGDGVWEWNLLSGRQFRSENWYRMLGYAPADGEAETDGFWSSRIHPEDYGRVFAALAACLSGETESYSADYRMRGKNGDWCWVAAHGRVVERESGKPVRMLGVHRDIHALRCAEHVGRANRESFVVLLEHLPDAIAITTCELDGVFIAVNRAYCELAASSAEELIGTRTSSHQLWGNDAQRRAVRELIVRGGAIDDLQSVFRNKRGDEIATSLSARRIVIDGEYRLIVSRRDIRRRVEIEQRLRQSEERWRFAIEGHGDALWEWRVDERTIYRSPRWLSMLGLPDSAVLASQEEHGAAFFTEDLPEVSIGFREMLAGHADELDGECRLRRADGEQIWVSYRCRTMERNGDGRPTKIIGTTRDITQRKLRQKMIDAQLDRLSHADRLLALGEMASAIAHEVNQPLGVVASYAGVLVRKAADHPELRELAVRIENETLRAGQVVWRMRQFSRHGQLDPVALDLRALIDESLEWVRLDNRVQGIGFEVELPEVPLPVRVDRVLIEQALLNLLRNSIQSMADSEHPRSILVRARIDGAQVVVDVADRGCGLPSQVACDVFQPFFTTKPDGLGLGLSITQSIVARHGGRLWSAAREGGGTVFSFSVPVDGECKGDDAAAFAAPPLAEVAASMERDSS